MCNEDDPANGFIIICSISINIITISIIKYPDKYRNAYSAAAVSVAAGVSSI